MNQRILKYILRNMIKRTFQGILTNENAYSLKISFRRPGRFPISEAIGPVSPVPPLK